ncbi:hypothetical protein HNO53_13010 [Billgrantia antri]|uniref:Restriction endonuclease n=1 Tax=Halomonas sulfidivorans TaxID=2733488 RepID=A0ABX7WHE6_9GAMM|nr:hypothetical protein [Halomonas sulfidivorans]QTP59555.1 hypothetical protein HNO53_13010 [Halomonas sulfidivorans]
MNLLTQLQNDYHAGLLSKELFEKYTSELTTSTQVEMPCEREDLFIRPVNVQHYRLFGKLSEDELQALYDNNIEEFKVYVAEGYDYSQAINWNKYNELKSKGVTYHFNIMEPFVKLPRINGAYASSCFEAHLMLNTKLSRANYEDKSSHVQYTLIATYKPDFVSPLNPDILFESKGIFRDAAEAKKYKLVSEQTGKIIIFIFQARDIEILWQKKRVDGTRQTHEQWCQKNGFLYTYADEFDDFIKSATYRNLLRAYNK